MTVRIGCASGFWGDSQIAAAQLVRRTDLHFLVLDYLAEITMALLGRAGSVSADGGYATDFVTGVMAPLLPEIAARNIRVVTNAGGVNPKACASAVRHAAERHDLDLRVAVVEGDDLLERADELLPRLAPTSDAPLPAPEQLVSLNAYLGAAPIARALDDGADVVVTGRAVDSALVLGPLVHEHRWRGDDFDRLAAGSLAGHVIECGAQATGGLFTDWRQVPAWEDIGYPVVECSPDGSFVLTKPTGTGGLVTPATVAEQIVYEIDDPSAYVLPDVICDFSQVRLEQVGPERVRLTGARGRPPPDDYKVTATFEDGYRATAIAMLCGIDAVPKAERVAAAMLARVRAMLAQAQLPDFRATHVEVLGSEAIYGPHARARSSREVVLRLSVHHDSRRAVSLFAKEVASAGTSFAPGLSGVVGGRARPAPMLRLASCLLPKDAVPLTVTFGETRQPAPARLGELMRQAEAPTSPLATARLSDQEPDRRAAKPAAAAAAAADTSGELRTVPLVVLAHARSGDKGNRANIGVIARDPAVLPVLRAQLTPRAVAAYLAHLLDGGAAAEVQRYEWPGLDALNFVLQGALGGGGLASLRYDAQGKGLAQLLLDLPVSVPAAWLEPGGLLAGTAPASPARS